MSVIVVDFRSRHRARLLPVPLTGRMRDQRIRDLIAECVAALYLNPADELHGAIWSALHELLDAKPRRLASKRSAS